jgi:glycine cleavage system transcriptional repressor
MDQRFIMTAFGEDRPGIVADVTRILFENGCNLEDSTMTLLADEFSLILLFSCQGQNVEEVLLKECRRLERDKGISAFLRPLKTRPGGGRKGFSRCTLHVEGLDQAGIVYRISQFLAERELNILDLKSRVKPSPESGTTLYVMDIHVQVPEGTPMQKVEEGLARVADELHVDIIVSQ